MRAGRAAAGVLAGALVTAGSAAVSAHRHDEYLQASRIAIAPGSIRIEMSLTPGIAVADAVIGEIDIDRDAVLSARERQAYAQRVLAEVRSRRRAPFRAQAVLPRPSDLRVDVDVDRLDGSEVDRHEVMPVICPPFTVRT